MVDNNQIIIYTMLIRLMTTKNKERTCKKKHRLRNMVDVGDRELRGGGAEKYILPSLSQTTQPNPGCEEIYSLYMYSSQNQHFLKARMAQPCGFKGILRERKFLRQNKQFRAKICVQD